MDRHRHAHLLKRSQLRRRFPSTGATNNLVLCERWDCELTVRLEIGVGHVLVLDAKKLREVIRFQQAHVHLTAGHPLLVNAAYLPS